MNRYFVKIQYNGSNYHGWQIQDNAVTVQGEINNALKLLLGKDIKTTGCGRTDAGVNASQFYFHFDTDNLFENFAYRLNAILSNDIVIQEIDKVDPEAHARFDATARTYHYFIHTKPNPFLGDFSCYIKQELDVEKMNLVAKILLKTTDFTSFSKLHTENFTNNCKVTKAKFEVLENGRLKFEITADRFLRNMVRAIVGTLIEVGKNKLSEQGFQEIINSENRQNAGKSMKGEALFLAGVSYDYL